MQTKKQRFDIECPTCSKETIYYKTIDFLQIAGIIDRYEQRIYCCNNCGFIFTPDVLDEEHLSNYYKNISKYEGNDSGYVSSDKMLMSQRQMQFIENSMISYESVLEIGASTGFNLYNFKKKNKKVLGIEPSSKNKETAKKNYGVDLFDGMYQEYFKKNSEEKFDLAIMSHVLEHIPNPNETIKKLSIQNIKYIYIEVPSFELQLKAEPYGAFFYEHINHFTTNSLTYLMKKNGYYPINLSIDYNVNNASPNFPVICSLWEKNRVKNLKKIILPSNLLLENYFFKSEILFKNIQTKISNISKNSKIAIWGTGSHTSRLLGMTKLQNLNIIKFYDSDTKRHRFKILNKLITSFDVSDIHKGFVDTIIISTFSGEKSILKYLSSLNIEINIVSFYD